MKVFFARSMVVVCASLNVCSALSEKVVLRVGHFPNVTHAQAVIGHGLSRLGRGWFEKRLGPDVEIRWLVFNGGATAMQAIFAQSIDLAYVGPNPSINAHIRSRGDEIRILAGACSGGSALLVEPESPIQQAGDFAGRRIGTPQFGNTQDVAARNWLRSNGIQVKLTGGDAFVVPATAADLLALFKKRDLDAVWAVEPTVSRLVLEAGARVFLEEGSLWPETGGRYATTHLVSRVATVRENPKVVKLWVAAHLSITEWINANPAEAKRILAEELRAETNHRFPADLLDSAWQRLEFTCDPIQESVVRAAHDAYGIGFLRREPDLSRIYDLRFLDEARKEREEEVR